jgi:uncharacterized GH25 family protein
MKTSTGRRSRRAAALAIVTATFALSAASLAAHDMWIEPTTFSPALGEIVGLKLRVGQDLLGDPLPRDPALINQFVVEDPEGRKPVVGRSGGDPAGVMRVAAAGMLVVGYRSNPSTVTLTPEKFDQYVKEEGLESMAALRARRGQTGSTRDMFSRCAKSLVLSGPASQAQGDRALGFTLELIAERNPAMLASGQDLPVRLVYENRPLAGALVVAINRAHPAEKLSARSDQQGRVRFRLPRGGMWLIKAVHMTEAPAGADADWVSYWASLTFAAGEPGSQSSLADRPSSMVSVVPPR